MQLPGRAVTDSLPRFSWKNVFNWQQLTHDLIEVAIIIAISFLFYRFVKLVVKRLVAIKIDEDDPLVRRMREQRAQTLGSLFTNVALVFVVTITVLTVLSVFINIGPLLASVSAGPPLGGLYLKPPSVGGLCDGVMTMPSATPPSPPTPLPPGERGARRPRL